MEEARARSTSPARSAFEALARSPEPSVFRLAALIAAEETYPDVSQDEMHGDLLRSVHMIASDAATRLRIERLLGKSPAVSELQQLAGALSATIFGPSERKPSDPSGMFEVLNPSDPRSVCPPCGSSCERELVLGFMFFPRFCRGALLHEVVARRSGSAFALSIIYMETAASMGLPLQPLAVNQVSMHRSKA